MKIYQNCLIQATLGSIPVSDPTFNQDIAKIFRSGIRISQCLADYISIDPQSFSVLQNAISLSKCFKAKLWWNSKHVSRQLDKIGIALSTLLVNAGITSFDKILKTNPRDIELILNRNPPFGNIIIDKVKHLPIYDIESEQLSMSQNNRASILITVILKNVEDVRNERALHEYHRCTLLVGDADNKVLLNKKIKDSELLHTGQWTKKIDIIRALKGDEVNLHLISDTYVGLDMQKYYKIEYNTSLLENIKEKNKSSAVIPIIKNPDTNSWRACNHKCLDKRTCAHNCCKAGVTTLTRKNQVESFFEEMQQKMSLFPSEKIKVSTPLKGSHKIKSNTGIFDSKKDRSTKPFSNVARYNSTKDNFKPPNEMMVNENENMTPTLEQLWNEDENMPDIWSDFMETESAETNTSLNKNLLFDINFENSPDDLNCGNAESKCTFEATPPQQNDKKHSFSDEKLPKREIWTKEQWNDPKKSEELLQKCVAFLTNY